MIKNLNENEKETVVRYIGELYRDNKKRSEILNHNTVNEDKSSYTPDSDLIRIVDITLDDCSIDTQLIIRNEYLKAKNRRWYQEYYSPSTYYRLRKEAVKEFLKGLFF